MLHSKNFSSRPPISFKIEPLLNRVASMQKRFFSPFQSHLRISFNFPPQYRVRQVFLNKKHMSSTAEAQPTKKQKMNKVWRLHPIMSKGRNTQILPSRSSVLIMGHSIVTKLSLFSSSDKRPRTVIQVSSNLVLGGNIKSMVRRSQKDKGPSGFGHMRHRSRCWRGI